MSIPRARLWTFLHALVVLVPLVGMVVHGPWEVELPPVLDTRASFATAYRSAMVTSCSPQRRRRNARCCSPGVAGTGSRSARAASCTKRWWASRSRRSGPFRTAPAPSLLPTTQLRNTTLLAQHRTNRPTQDLDLFTSDSPSVATARDELEHAARVRGWTVTRIHDHEEFCRLIVHGPEDLLVDLALDAAPQQAGHASFLGPTFAPEELAARKLLALFDRAEARDFANAYVLAQRYSKHVLLERAKALDHGLDPTVLAQFMSTLSRYDDADIPVASEPVAELRRFITTWQAELHPQPAP